MSRMRRAQFLRMGAAAVASGTLLACGGPAAGTGTPAAGGQGRRRRRSAR